MVMTDLALNLRKAGNDAVFVLMKYLGCVVLGGVVETA
jgi:hypothetical protein